MREKSGKRNLLLAATIVGLGLSASMNPAHADDLWDAINTAASAGLYTLNSDYTLPDGKSSLGDLKVGVFVLEGNNKSIELNKKSGVSIDDDKSMTIRNAIIKNALNSAEGGAIYNEGKLEITGSQFNDDHADDDDAGAIWNEGTVTKILADFNNNGATDNGGAIYNKGTITTISGNFIGNRAEDDGGAIYNKGTISSISGKFNRNTSGDDGGAICNKSGATINEINATFWGNQLIDDQGGAIYNDGTIGTIKGSFENNGVLDGNKGPHDGTDYNSRKNQGGAVYNHGKITSIDADFTNNIVVGEQSRGGAIWNDGTIGSIHGNFKGNVDLMRDGYSTYVAYGGGAIYNDDDGRIGSITGTFTENAGQTKKQFLLDNDGGAILNTGNITSINADFYRNSTLVNGGAIFNFQKAHIGSISGTFEGNIAEPEEYWGYIHEEDSAHEKGGKGGAIYNRGTIDSISGKFTNNKATYFTGGAIQNHANVDNAGTIKSINADFIGNRAFYAGGAIANDHRGFSHRVPFISSIKGNFINNWVYGLYQPYKDDDPWKDKGGAIWNNMGAIAQISGYFEGNSSQGQGGAIWENLHSSLPTTISASFKNNYAYHLGGAIYHDDGDLIITTEDNTDTIFSGNMQFVHDVQRDDQGNITSILDGVSNAIFNNDYVEFNVKDGRTIWMYDSLAGNDGAGWDWKKTGAGTLALGEDNKGVKGDVLIEQGIVKLVQNDRNSSIYGTGFSSADVTYKNNTYIDSQNNHIEDVCLGSAIVLDGTLHSLIDVNLAEQKGDKLVIYDDSVDRVSGSGSIVIDSIKIITGGGTYDESTKNILIAGEQTKGKISLGSNLKLTGEGFKNWVLSYIPTTGILNFQRGLSLKEVTNLTEPESRVFNAPDDEIVNDNIGNIGHDNATLVVNMNNYAINGKKDDTYHSGFVTTAGDQILTVNDAEVINFKGSNGSFIYDDYGAEININNSTIKNNEAANGGIIYSRGNLLTLTDSNIMDNKISGLGGAIYSKGNVTVNAINNEVQFAGNYKEVGGDIITTNAIYMEGTAENPITLTLNSKDSAHAVSIGDKVDGSHYNIVINDAEDSLGNILFGNSVNTGSLTLNKGVLENNGTVTVTSGTNNGTITYDSTLGLKGDFILDDKGSTLVFNNNGSFTQNSLTIKSGEFKTDLSNLHISSDIVNDGAIIFNNTTNGSINQNIKGSTTSSNGIVEIAASDKVTVDLNGYTITNNDVKLTSGILDVTSNADTDGNINLSSMGLVTGNGTLNLQDNKACNINLGDIKTGTGTNAKNLNVAIDMHFVTDTVDPAIINEYADIISANSLTGDGKIHVKDIKMSKDDSTEPVTPSSTITTMSVEVARGAAAIANMDFTGTTITNIDKTFSSVMLTYGSGWLTVSSTTPTLEKAITSYVSTKLYAMGVDGTGAGIDENIDNLVLNGVHLAVTTNGADILSTSGDNSTDGIHLADGEETLTLYGKLDESGNPETKISGFKTAIDNLAGGEVHLENIEMSNNTTDVLNAGKLNLDGKNIINTIADNTTEPMGSTNIVGGTSTIGSIVQKAVNILPDSELNINADKLSATDGVDNWGRLNLGSGNLASNIFESQLDTKQGVTNIVGDVTNTSDKTIAQKSVTIANTASLTTDADKVTADDGIANSGNLNLTGGELASSVNGTGTTNINGDVTNLSRNIINQKSIAIDSTSSLTSLAGKLVAEDGITNEGTLNLTNGNLASSVNGTGTTNIETYVETNGNNITQSTVNVGQNGTEEAGGYLLNDAIINATNINVTKEGEFGNIGTISATTIANAGNVYIEDGSVNVSSITTDANASTIINGGSVNADNITNNGETNITGGTVVADIIENTGGGTTTIAGGDVVANTSITNSGTGDTDIYSVVKTPLVSATNGAVNINATGQTATSNLLKDLAGTGLANVTAASGAEVNINTNSRALVIDNNVSGAGTLNLNGAAGSEFYIGPNATVSSALNIASGQLNAGDGSNITSPISVATNATLSTMNDNYSTFNNITFADGSNLKVDVNAISNQTDNFVTPVEPVGGSIFLKDLNIQDISQMGTNGTSINLSQSIGLNNLQSSDDLMANLNAKYGLTPIRRRNINVQMTPEGLMLNIAGMGNKYKDFNPAVMASSVAAQMGGYLTQLNSYDEAFRNMDMYMLMTYQQRQALKFKNKYAASDSGLLYDSTLLRQERAEGWFRPYVTFEKVGLRNGPKVENQAYGTFVGGDSKMYDLGHGWDSMWGAYVGYNGSHQNYDGVSIYQNGGTLGLTGMAYKGNFFTGLTINAGASAAEAHTMYGHEDLTMLMAGIASKTGYNWELANGKFIIQPSWLMSYSFVNTFDYTNAAGVRMHSSPLNAIQLQPELKFIGNLKNGWQPYASVAMVWNIMDDTKFKANDVTLPELSVKPYVKYGVGVRKTWGERFTGFFQTYLTNGGRNGVGLQAGFTWALGGGKDKKADEQKIQKSLKRAPELKKTEIVLNGRKI